MRAADILENEHKAVLVVLDVARKEAADIDRTGQVNVKRVREMIDFFKNFVDRCHHGKEERHLFPKLEQRGIPNEGGPIGVMLQEHAMGRSEVWHLSEAVRRVDQGDPLAPDAIREHLLAYAGLLEVHIGKENAMLYPMGDQVLTEEDQRALVDAFAAVEKEEMGEGVHERYHQWIEELVKE